MAEELTVSYAERVTVILPSACSGHGPRIGRLPGVKIIERAELDQRAFLDAQVQSAALGEPAPSHVRLSGRTL